MTKVPPADPQRVVWLYHSRPGRALAWAILLSACAVVGWVKYGGVRDPGVVTAPALQWVLGWTPSLLTAVALPFSWPAFATAPKPLWAVVGCAEALWAGVILLLLEVLDLTDASSVFSGTDVAGVILGSLLGFLLYRILVRRRDQAGANA